MNETRRDLARRFVSKGAELAKRYDLDFFVVTEGASGVSNSNTPAVEHARSCHVEWERAHGIDPEHDWSMPSPDCSRQGAKGVIPNGSAPFSWACSLPGALLWGRTALKGGKTPEKPQKAILPNMI